VRSDGMIDVEYALDQLARNLDADRSRPMRRRPNETELTIPSTADTRAAAQLLRARAMSASVDAERKRRAFNLERGRYLLADQAEAEWNKAIAKFLLQIEHSFPDLAVELGLDRAKTAALRRWWRNQRTKAADEFAASTADLPEFVEDNAA